ncbi:hypothetical protein [Streptomyces sp. NPDC056682]|uniref:hypothetical protein n=1 Tax=Streptomyces sp. NPDC056682 TaxID=3345909 RepID=UPI00367778C9
MGWDIRLGGLDPAVTSQVMRHPEQVGNLAVVTRLLERFDAAGHDGDELHDLQAVLYRVSYRAQRAADGIGRALHRVEVGKGPDWPPAAGQESIAFAAPDWRLRCAADSRDVEEWRLERWVTERVIRQLRAVGDALAWRVFSYDRRAIVALSRNDPPGPFWKKAGLGYELGTLNEIREQRGSFVLLHDLTSVVRIMDMTEVEASGRRLLREVKASDSPSATAKARKQIKRAERLLAAIDGAEALPGEEAASLWRAQTQFRTHLRKLAPLLDRAQRAGTATAWIGGRVVGALHLPVTAQRAQPEEGWSAYAAARGRLLDRHLGAGTTLHRLRGVSADTAGRDPATAPWGIYPLPAHHRAALICDYLVLEMFISADDIARRFRRLGLNAVVLLPGAHESFDSRSEIISVTDPRRQRRLVLHGAAVSQLLMEFVHTDRLIQASAEALRLPHTPSHSLLIYSNESPAWY